MQLDDIDSFIDKMFRLNKMQLECLAELRELEGGLTYSDLAEYKVRVRDDDNYRKIRREINAVRRGSDIAKTKLYDLLADRVDDLSEESVERIRRNSKHLPSGKWWGSDRKKVDRPLKGIEKSDKKFLESMSIKGDTSWIEN